MVWGGGRGEWRLKKEKEGDDGVFFVIFRYFSWGKVGLLENYR